MVEKKGKAKQSKRNLVSREAKQIIKKKIVSDNDDEKINNEINIKIDLSDLKKTKPKQKKTKTKPKPKTLDDMKSGATINTASSTAPVKMGSSKMPSNDTPFNPYNNMNNLISVALQNAYGNRLLQPQQQALPAPLAPPALPAPLAPPALPAPLAPPALPAPLAQQALPAPPPTQPRTPIQQQAPPTTQYIPPSQLPNFQKLINSREADDFHEAIAEELSQDQALVQIYLDNKGKPGVNKITRAYQRAINNLSGDITRTTLGNTNITLASLMNSADAFYKPSLIKFKKIVDSNPPPPAAPAAPAAPP